MRYFVLLSLLVAVFLSSSLPPAQTCGQIDWEFDLALSAGKVVAVAAGSRHSMALKNDATVLAWESNEFGQLGDGTTTDRWRPVQVCGLARILAVVAGGGHSLAVTRYGRVWAWGDNYYGQLGDGTTTTKRLTPIQVVGLTGVLGVAAREWHSLALQGDGTVWAWGLNSTWQLGDGTTTNRLIPVQLNRLTRVVAVAAGGLHSLAVKSDGSVWAWGRNRWGQLGDGTTTDRWTPIQVFGL